METVKGSFDELREEVTKTLKEYTQAMDTKLHTQDRAVGHRLSEFLTNLEAIHPTSTSPVPWNAVLDRMEERLQAVEGKTCKCTESRPWSRGTGTRADPLELVEDNDEVGSALAEEPPSSDDSYGTPPVAAPEIVDERRDGEPLQVLAPRACCERVATPHPISQVGIVEIRGLSQL